MLASAGSTIKFWNTENFELIQDLHTNSCNISNLSWNKDGHFLAALDEKSSEISLYTVSSSTAICSGILRIMDNINCLQFCNTTNRYMAVGGARDSVLIWDMKGNTKKKSFMVTRAGITKLCFSSSDSHLAVGTVLGDGFLLSNTNNLVTGPVKLFSEKTKVMDIRYSAISRSLVGVCSENGSFVFMDTNATKVLKEFPQVHSAPASALAFSPINELLMITVGCDKRFITYNANSKSIVMAHHTPAPLTSVCFLSSGQCVALGTMTGEVFIYDLRVLNTPMVTLAAQEGPVLDLRIQPQGKVTGGNLTKEMFGSKNITQKSDVPAHQEKTRQKIDKTGIDAKIGKSYSPAAELLSPMKIQTNREERMSLKNTPLLKNLGRTMRSSKRSSFGMDDLGILSPIDKENKIPTSSEPPENLQRQSSTKPSLMVEGLLSPLDSSSKSNMSPLSSSPGKQTSRNADGKYDESIRVEKDLTKVVDEILSPLRNESEFAAKAHTSSLASPHTVNVKETVSMATRDGRAVFPSKIEMTPEERPSTKRERGHNVSIDRVKRNLLKDVEGRTLEEDSLSLSFSGQAVEDSGKLLLSNIPERDFLCDVSKPYDVCQVNEERQSCKLNRETQQMLGSVQSKGDETTSSTCGSRDFPEPSREASGPSINREASQAFEIAFPVTEKENQETTGSTSSSRHQRNSLNPNPNSGDVSHMNLELVRNCVSEALERHQFCVNQRFMHLQYTMVKHFFNLSKEMKELIKEFSLNEELLAENERLREEVEKLRCTY